MPEHERKVLVYTGPREVKGKQRPQEAGEGSASVMNTLTLPSNGDFLWEGSIVLLPKTVPSSSTLSGSGILLRRVAFAFRFIPVR